jgi:hypothetical protein
MLTKPIAIDDAVVCPAKSVAEPTEAVPAKVDNTITGT